MATATYNISTYLLDRANIHYTVTKMCLLLDLKKFSELATDVFDEQVRVDYTSLLGGELYTISGG
ncbi:hypothetical protein HYALB_00002172 [Hymenoscyphus albidus]|uniref:SnoaL-like domain-containing protein n=1 Tax=Hymenoscyphus albidus TaxID=595503 RepID=A0A9N9LSC0_9HELO|nr:hypothetical protein HYALB_00002172 [Hymenoscyphus albidus]